MDIKLIHTSTHAHWEFCLKNPFKICQIIGFSYVPMSKKLRKIKGGLLNIPTFRIDLTIIHSVFTSSDFLFIVI